MHIRSQILSNSEDNSDSSVLPSRKQKVVNQGKYKTRMCRNYTMGMACPFGERCVFSHGEPEVSVVSGEEVDSPSEQQQQQQQPPPYSDLVPCDNLFPPAYSLRFRHDPYFGGVVYVT